MGRVSREQAELNRERIVETACTLFRQHGVENVSIADVMASVGLTAGGFYKQFESKDALIDEAFALAFEQSAASWAKTLGKRTAKGTAPQTLARRYFTQRASKQVCPLLSFASQVSQQSADAHSTQLYEAGAIALYRQFESGLSNDETCADKQPAESHALLLFAAMVGAGMLSRAIGSGEWIESLQDAVLDAIPAPA